MSNEMMVIVIVGVAIKVLSLIASFSSGCNSSHSSNKNVMPEQDYAMDIIKESQRQQNDEFNRRFTEESLKSVTPFDMGGNNIDPSVNNMTFPSSFDMGGGFGMF